MIDDVVWGPLLKRIRRESIIRSLRKLERQAEEMKWKEAAALMRKARRDLEEQR